MEFAELAGIQARNLWYKLARPALLQGPALGMSVALVVLPYDVSAASTRHSKEFSSAQLMQGQLRAVRSYEHYLARVKAQGVKARRAVHFAYRQLGKPYQWGGAGPRSYDCSGLAMAAWRRAGLHLPHRADLQHQVIRRKVPFRHLRPGDLVFFSGDNHVGIYVGRGRFIHAPHTGTVVQRGFLTGWRRHAFAGAARPGAPAYHDWPQWVRSLARRLRAEASPPRVNVYIEFGLAGLLPLLGGGAGVAPPVAGAGTAPVGVGASPGTGTDGGPPVAGAGTAPVGVGASPGTGADGDAPPGRDSSSPKEPRSPAPSESARLSLEKQAARTPEPPRASAAGR